GSPWWYQLAMVRHHFSTFGKVYDILEESWRNSHAKKLNFAWVECVYRTEGPAVVLARASVNHFLFASLSSLASDGRLFLLFSTASLRMYSIWPFRLRSSCWAQPSRTSKSAGSMRSRNALRCFMSRR